MGDTLLRDGERGVEYRLFFFALDRNRFVIVHAIVKKSQKLKGRDIRTALSRIGDVLTRIAEKGGEP
jgi:phage-related protein